MPVKNKVNIIRNQPVIKYLHQKRSKSNIWKYMHVVHNLSIETVGRKTASENKTIYSEIYDWYTCASCFNIAT